MERREQDQPRPRSRGPVLRGSGSRSAKFQTAGAIVQQDDHEHRSQLRSQQLRFAGMGLEFGSGIAGFVLLGWWIDRSFNTEPVALVTGAVLGSVGGLYVLIRRAFEMQKEASPPRRSGDERKDDSGEPGPN